MWCFLSDSIVSLFSPVVAARLLHLGEGNAGIDRWPMGTLSVDGTAQKTIGSISDLKISCLLLKAVKHKFMLWITWPLKSWLRLLNSSSTVRRNSRLENGIERCTGIRNAGSLKGVCWHVLQHKGMRCTVVLMAHGGNIRSMKELRYLMV